MKSIVFKGLVLSFLIFPYNLQAQGNFTLLAGVGMAEFTHIGFEYGNNKSEIGINAGFLPLNEEYLLTFSGSYIKYFKSTSKYADLRPWYGRLGLQYSRDETQTMIEKYLFLNTSVGRNFYFLENFGIGLEAGALLVLYHDRIDKDTIEGWELGLDSPVLPAMALTFFYIL